MVWIYISIILLCRVVQAIFSKRASLEVKNLTMQSGYSAFYYSVSAVLGIILLAIEDKGFPLDWLTLLFSLISGVSLFLCTFCGISAMKNGTVSLNSMFGTAGMLIPIAAGMIFWNQPVSVMQWVGLAGFFVASFFLVKGSKKIYSGFSLKTALLLLVQLLSNGATMVAQQLFTTYVPDGSVTMFSFISFATAALLGYLMFVAMKLGGRAEGSAPVETGLSKILFVCGISLAVAVFVINQLATISTALISPVILFTFINGGSTVISTLVAAIMYKEKLSANIIIGVLLGVVSLIVIKSF